MATEISSKAPRSPTSGSAQDLETAAKAALVQSSATSEKSADERLADAKDEIAADTRQAARKPD